MSNNEKKLTSSNAAYKLFDLALVLVVTVVIYLGLYIFGKYYSFFPSFMLFGYKIRVFGLFEVLFIIMILLLRKQTASSVGLSKKNAYKSFKMGMFIGSIFLVVAIVIAELNNSSFKGVNYLIFATLYYSFEIAFAEELIFRGYIMTRLTGILKSKKVAIIISGVLFSLSHIPFQIQLTDYSLLEFIANRYSQLIITFGYHFLFVYLYNRYNNIIAPTVVHMFINLSFNLFV